MRDLLVRVTEGAPDRADAGRRAERFCEAATLAGVDLAALSDDAVKILRLACQRAPYLASLLFRDPTRLLRVASDPYLHREKPAEVVAAEVTRATSAVAATPALLSALRRIRADELVRLGARELELGLDTEVGRELARLADACFGAALAFHDRALRAVHGPPQYRDDAGNIRDAELVVIGMGKLGGDELNFSSDVDVIYVYSSDQGAAGALSLHDYFAKLSTLVTAALAEVTSDELVFRVDLRLRPEGSRGAITNSLAQLERYYETFGRAWERQAWLKARPCAGSRELGAEVMTTLRPFVFPRHTSPKVLEEVRALNRRIKQELTPAWDRGAELPSYDVKNGIGGIREIEFFIQALQLIHAGRNPQLRVRGSRAALDQLLFAGLISDDEHRALGDAYRWLRHLEHVLQLEAGLQTQRLPDTVMARSLLARRLGYGNLEAFSRELARHTDEVARLFATLGDPDGEGKASAMLLEGGLDGDTERALWLELGFTDPSAAATELVRARLWPDSPLGTALARSDRALGLALLDEISRSADPDQALRFVVDLIGRRRGGWSLWRLLADSRDHLRLLVSVFGASEYLARTLMDRPELIDLLVAVGQVSPRVEPAALRAEARRRLAAAAVADPDDLELRWSALAELKNSQVLRVALGDFAGRLAPLEVSTELTHIAEVCLSEAFDLVADSLIARHGRPRHPDGTPATMAVLALGKLGGGELGYAADLDVVFVYSGDGSSDGERPLEVVEYMTRLAQRLMSALHARTPRGRLYEVDTRLRPSGSQGLLVSSLAAWRRYHHESARTWERQALLKLRPVAGDAELGGRAVASAADWLWGAPPSQNLADEIVAMRARIDRELGHPADLKTGPGGILDIEFAAQFLQLAHGHTHPGLRTPSTTGALAAAAAAGVADGHDLTLLGEAYVFLRGLEHRLRVIHDRPDHRLPTGARELEQLARRTGFPDGAALTARVDRWRRDVHDAYLRTVVRSETPDAA